MKKIFLFSVICILNNAYGMRPAVFMDGDKKPLLSEMEGGNASYGTVCERQNQCISPLPSSSLKSMESFFEHDQEYQQLLVQAQQNNSTDQLKSILNNAYAGQSETVIGALGTINTKVGTLPLRAAAIGGKLETIQRLIKSNYFTGEDVKSAFFDLFKHDDVATAKKIIDQHGITFDNEDFAKALSIRDIDYSFFELFDKHVQNKTNFLKTAVQANSPCAVQCLLDRNAFVSEDLIAEANTPAIKRLLVLAKAKKEEEKRQEESKIFWQVRAELAEKERKRQVEREKEESTCCAMTIGCVDKICCCHDGPIKASYLSDACACDATWEAPSCWCSKSTAYACLIPCCSCCWMDDPAPGAYKYLNASPVYLVND